nr:MAG TPA: hypothetical protein [Caudoviricetes sp.]DAS92194.1 MAG TPA: hypothetical protein [Caudoviricetes sp.]
MDLELLGSRLERIGFSCEIICDTLQIWSANMNAGTVDLEGNFYPGSDFIRLNSKERNQVVYLILKQKGAIDHEAIIEFGKAQGFE